MSRIELDTTQVEAWLREAGSARAAHLLGAGGCGMSGLGHLFLDLGFAVTGSDLQDNAEARGLRARGATIYTGHRAAQLPADLAPLVIRSAAVPDDNPEWVRAAELDLPRARRGRVLAAVAHQQRALCVAGMHGKTTTSAWLAHALRQLGADPSYAIGWQVPQLAPHARFSPSSPGGGLPWFVLEADESDGTLGEFRPRAAILLNLDEEHLDHFESFAAVQLEFGGFADQVRGPLVYCADDPRLAGLMRGRPGAVSYGCHPLADYRLEHTRCAPEPGPAGAPAAARSCFEIWHERRRLGSFETRLLGAQNLSNAAAVVAMLHQLGHAPADLGRAIAGFGGAGRRQERLWADARVTVYDDYGHHPNEIRATLRAMRSLAPRRLLVAFQPHRYTRTQQLLPEFATCFAGADRLWLLPVYAASEPPIPGVDSGLMARAIQEQGGAAEVVADTAELMAALPPELQPGDLVLFLGAGAEITAAAHAFARQLAEAGTGPESAGPASARAACECHCG